MKNEILEMLVDFADKIDNNTSVFSGSIYTKSDVVELISELANNIRAFEEPARPTRIDEETIKAIAKIAERWAINHAQHCAEIYEFDDIDFDTNDYRTWLTVTATVNVDTHSFSQSATFNTSPVEADLRELLTPNTQPNA
jgi:hypothetical protein